VCEDRLRRRGERRGNSLLNRRGDPLAVRAASRRQLRRSAFGTRNLRRSGHGVRRRWSGKRVADRIVSGSPDVAAAWHLLLHPAVCFQIILFAPQEKITADTRDRG